MDKASLRNCGKTCKRLAVAWVVYKRACEMVQHSLLREAVELMLMLQCEKTTV